MEKRCSIAIARRAFRFASARRCSIARRIRKEPFLVVRLLHFASQPIILTKSFRSDWTLDVTHPGVDAELGWQYAHSFDDPDDQWTSEPPPQLERLLSGSGAMTAGLAGSSSGGSGRAGPSRANSSQAHRWVRRRRWVRVMRRRLDIPPLPFLQPDGRMYDLDADGNLIPHVKTAESDFGDHDGQELASMSNTGLSSTQDYVVRARYLAGNQNGDAEGSNGEPSALDARRAIVKLERATTELRHGILGK